MSDEYYTTLSVGLYNTLVIFDIFFWLTKCFGLQLKNKTMYF